MKFVVELPDGEVYEAAEKPDDLGLEIAQVIANEIFGFSSVTVVPQPVYSRDGPERLQA